METLERIEKILTMLLIEQLGEGNQDRKIEVLSRAGLKNPDIAELLGTTAASVSQTLYVARKAGKKSKKPKAKKR